MRLMTPTIMSLARLPGRCASSWSTTACAPPGAPPAAGCIHGAPSTLGSSSSGTSALGMRSSGGPAASLTATGVVSYTGVPSSTPEKARDSAVCAAGVVCAGEEVPLVMAMVAVGEVRIGARANEEGSMEGASGYGRLCASMSSLSLTCASAYHCVSLCMSRMHA